MTDISIEYAHIYTNKGVEEEQKLSLEILGGVKQKLAQNNQTFSLVILVDDYSFPDPTFSYKEFSTWLSRQGYTPDFILRESQLTPICGDVLSKMDKGKLRDSLIEYTQEKKYPCSLFIAAWYLLRLGCLEHEFFKSELQAKKLLNILPTSFKPYEDKGLEIIGSTPYADMVPNIEYKFFEGRNLVN